MARIKKSVFQNFMKKVCVNGIVTDCILEVTNGDVKVSLSDTANRVLVNAELKSSAFKEKFDSCRIPIKNTSILLGSLGLFDDEINLSIKENKFIISDDFGSNTIELIMPNEEYIESHIAEPSVGLLEAYDKYFELPTERVSKLLDLSKDLDKDCSVEFVCDNNELCITLGQKGFDNAKIKEKVENENFSVKVGEIVKCVVGVATQEKLKVCGKPEMPLKVIDEDDDSIVEWYLAPEED